MNLQGFYTNKGRILTVKIAGGVTPQTVTRVAAGSGHTTDIPGVTSLPDARQTLTVGMATTSGTTATLPMTIAEAQAVQSYSLTELGNYADDPDEGEILFQVYQLVSADVITAGGQGVLRFYLRQSIGTRGVTIICSPAGLLVDEDLAQTRSKVLAKSAGSRTVTLEASELHAVLNDLPRMLTENITLNVSGTTAERINISGFFGSGSITIAGTAGHPEQCSFQNGIKISSCSCPVRITLCTILPNSDGWKETVQCEFSYLVRLYSCVLTGNGNSRGLSVDFGSRVYATGCTMTSHAV